MRLRMYLMAIIGLIMVLNIPEIRGDAMAYVQLHKPQVQNQITQWSDEYTPVIQTLIESITKAPQTIINGKLVDSVSDTPVDTDDTWGLQHNNSLTTNQIDAILREYKSPAIGSGAFITQYAASKDIDNAYILYMFIHESTAGTAKGWVGLKESGDTTHNPGNIRCYNHLPCYNGFVDYKNWEAGFRDQIDLLAFYRDELGDTTIIAALQRWAPSTDNNDQRLNCEEQKQAGTLSYPCGLMDKVGYWRSINKNATTIQKIAKPGKIHPITDDMKINASFNDANCQIWGFQSGCKHWGTDIAVCIGCPVYAPVNCTHILTDAYYDAPRLGDYIMCRTYDGYEFYSGHLDRAVKLTPGDTIAAGTIVGYGNKDVVGPHTHIQLRDPNGNLVDFMEYYQERVQ